MRDEGKLPLLSPFTLLGGERFTGLSGRNRVDSWSLLLARILAHINLKFLVLVIKNHGDGNSKMRLANLGVRKP